MQYEDQNVRVWASDLDPNALLQAQRTARLRIVTAPLALMPDAHVGMGATVGSVVPTEGAIIPSCVGVDIGCGMAAIKTDLKSSDLPDDLKPLVGIIAKAIPAGVGKGHDPNDRPLKSTHAADKWLRANTPQTVLDNSQKERAWGQFGTLGSGNHFVEVSLDEDDTVWVVLHSGSRGIGNILARGHIATAKKVAKRMEIGLEDPDLAYLLEGTPEFTHYVRDLLWAQAYARENRESMLAEAKRVFFKFVGKGREVERVNCHHNYTAQERHDGRDLWITRKGAISARKGELGIIPGSMGTDTFIVRGLGEPTSYMSSSHGAGRRLSRTQAKKQLSVESLEEAMAGKAWLDGSAKNLVDEHPDSYKDIHGVMRDQADLTETVARLDAVLNYKGT